MGEVIFPQGCHDSLFEGVVFFSVDILPAFTEWVFRQYFVGGHLSYFFVILTALVN
jgi:hypothetical protein